MKLNLNCPINSTSYGYVSSFFMRELDRLGYDIRHLPISPNSPDKDIHGQINHVLEKRAFHFDSSCLKIWHQHDLTGFTGSGSKIGYTIFELESFTDIEKHSLSYPDRVIVPSDWAKGVVNREVPSADVHVCPLGFDEDIFKPAPVNSKSTTIFGNFGKFEIRKGHDILASAFNSAFSENDDVLLVMMPHNFFLNQEEHNRWISRYKSTKLGHRMQFIPRVDTQKMVYNIMAQIDCGVFPSRAEGWNLEALELLACGKHLIITECSAHTEFANQENSLLISMDSGLERAFDQKFFFGQGEWHKFDKPEIEQLVENMRRIHKAKQEGSLQVNQAGIDSVQKFTWRECGKKLDFCIKDLI